MKNNVKCYFHHSNTCDITDNACFSICKHPMKEYFGLDYHGHLELYEMRKNYLFDRRIRTLCLIFSIIAITISIISIILV